MSIWEVQDEDEVVEGLDESGKPDPQYAAALGLINAPLGRRSLAFVIDLAFYLVFQIPYWVFTLPLLLKWYRHAISTYGLIHHPHALLALIMGGISFLFTLALVIVQLVLLGRRGVTIGKGIVGIRAVNVRTLQRPGFWRITLRALVVWASGVLIVGPILLLASPLFDPTKRKRGWHDKLANLWLIDKRNGLDPYDDKRMRVARKTVMATPVAQRKAMPSLATGTADGSYRPAGRVSAGVLGVARPHGIEDQTPVGLAGLEPAPLTKREAARGEAGKPVLGGYVQESAGAGDQQRHKQRPNLATPEGEQPAANRYGIPAASPAAPPVPAPAPAPAATTQKSASQPTPANLEPIRPMPEPMQPPAPAQPPAPSPEAAPPRYTLRFDNGDDFALENTLMVGRNPQPDPTNPAAVLAVADPSRSISKTHMRLQATRAGVEVTDQHSTNGCAVIHHGNERPCQPGVAVLAEVGDTIRFGERRVVVTQA